MNMPEKMRVVKQKAKEFMALLVFPVSNNIGNRAKQKRQRRFAEMPGHEGERKEDVELAAGGVIQYFSHKIENLGRKLKVCRMLRR